MIQNLILFSISAFILGSVPFGVIISRFTTGIDITKQGSGNIGATNVARSLGIKWGIVTLVLDFFKGFIPIYLCQKFFNWPEMSILIIGLTSLLGHQFSIFLKFRGGKGVSTVFGVFMAISPFTAIIAFLIFSGIVYRSDYVSLASIIAVSTTPILLLIEMKPIVYIIGGIVMAALICLKHKSNIQSLLKGEERRWRKRPAM
ncbi:glycerol-3-phosphate 1-O-acyltransferase PlsY [Thermodesulfobacteriota bacterium]